jgi:hypothetical protein
MKKSQIQLLLLGFVMGAAPQYLLANSIDWDEVQKTLTGGAPTAAVLGWLAWGRRKEDEA